LEFIALSGLRVGEALAPELDRRAGVLMTLCLAAIAVTNYCSMLFNFKLSPVVKRKYGIELLERRVALGSK
jgi:hypothetical protein